MPDSTNIEMRFSPNDIRILQALRAGPMQPDELSERLDGKYALAGLLKLGFVESTSMGYKITEAGRAACPSRRSTERLDGGILPPLQESTEKPKRVSTISIQDAARIAQQLGELKPSFQAATMTTTTPTETEKAERPKALTILEYIEAHPGCTNLEIAKGTGITAAQAYLKYHIKHGKVITQAGITDDRLKTTFILADGLTADSIYFNTKRPLRTNKSAPAKTKNDAAADSFARASKVVEDFAQTMQQISQENTAADEQNKPETKVLKLNLPQRHDAEFCIKTLLKLMPHSHVITIRKARDGGGLAEIDGRTLAEQIAPNLGDIDITLSALNTINQAMAS